MEIYFRNFLLSHRFRNGRSDKIRTFDPLHPIQVLILSIDKLASSATGMSIKLEAGRDAIQVFLINMLSRVKAEKRSTGRIPWKC
jgi:hypothetical protein